MNSISNLILIIALFFICFILTVLFLKVRGFQKKYFFNLYYHFLLKKLIKKDFIPNGYCCCFSAKDLNVYYTSHITYVQNIENHVSKEFYSDEELYNQYKNIYKKEETVVKFYTGFIGAKMNKHLRNKQKEEFLYSKELKQLSNLINKFKSDISIIGLRRMPSSIFDSLKKGEIYIEKGFLGCSLKIDERFEEQQEYKAPLENEALLLLKIPKGTNAYYAEPISKR